MLINAFLDVIVIIASKFLSWGKTARIHFAIAFIYGTSISILIVLQVKYLLFTTLTM